MSDQIYRLIVDMSTRGTLGPQLEKAKNAGGDLKGLFDKAKDSAAGIGGAIADTFTGAVERAADLALTVGKIGAAAVVAGSMVGIHLNSELEKTQISIGAILSAQGKAGGMAEGFEKAGGLIKEMKRDAAMLPGEFKDLLTFFKLGATPGFQLGATTGRMEKLSANAMAASAAVGIQMDQAARELAQLLQGHAGGHNVFGQLLGFSGGEAQKFNKLTGEARLKAVEGALGKYEGAIEFYGSSFDALSSTLVDNGKTLLQKATAPIFSRVKEEMAAANKWIDQNEVKLGRLTERVGQGLDGAFRYGLDHIKSWGPALASFAHNTGAQMLGIWRTVQPMFERAEKLAQGAAADPGLMGKIGGVGAAYGATKLGGMFVPVAKAGAGLAEAAGAGGGVTALAGLLVAADAAAAMVALGGAIHILNDETSMFHDSATELWTSIKEHGAGAFTEFHTAFVKVEPALIGLADFAGHQLLTSINLGASAFEFFASTVGRTVDFAVSKLKILNDMSGGALGDLFGVGGKEDTASALYSKLLERERFVRGDDDGADSKKSKHVTGGGGTNIQKVEIVISSNQDPSRIARATVDELAARGRNPTFSRHVRNWGSMNP